MDVTTDLSFPGSALGINCLAFHPDGKLLAAGAYYEVDLWEVEKQTKAARFDGLRHATGVTFSPNGKRLYASDKTGAIKIWEVASRRHLFTIREKSGPVQA